MKREIKFRAWDKSDNRMIINEQDFIPVIVTSMGVLRLNPHHEENFWEFISDERFELMQFTGLKDKNGKDIYEGDIISTSTDKLMVISWSDRFASFCIKRDGWAFQHWFGEACNPDECEVVGNIYENSELLKS